MEGGAVRHVPMRSAAPVGECTDTGVGDVPESADVEVGGVGEFRDVVWAGDDAVGGGDGGGVW